MPGRSVKSSGKPAEPRQFLINFHTDKELRHQFNIKLAVLKLRTIDVMNAFLRAFVRDDNNELLELIYKEMDKKTDKK